MPKRVLISPYEDISSLGVRTLSSSLRSQGIDVAIVHVVPAMEQDQKYVTARDDAYNDQALRRIVEELRPLPEELDRYHPIDISLDQEYLVSGGRSERLDPSRARELLPRHPFGKPMYRCNASRGCPFSCSYDCNNTLKRMRKGRGCYIRWRSVDNVTRELVPARDRLGVESLRFMDDFGATLESRTVECCR